MNNENINLKHLREVAWEYGHLPIKIINKPDAVHIRMNEVWAAVEENYIEDSDVDSEYLRRIKIQQKLETDYVNTAREKAEKIHQDIKSGQRKASDSGPEYHLIMKSGSDMIDQIQKKWIDTRIHPQTPERKALDTALTVCYNDNINEMLAEMAIITLDYSINHCLYKQEPIQTTQVNVGKRVMEYFEVLWKKNDVQDDEDVRKKLNPFEFHVDNTIKQHLELPELQQDGLKEQPSSIKPMLQRLGECKLGWTEGTAHRVGALLVSALDLLKIDDKKVFKLKQMAPKNKYNYDGAYKYLELHPEIQAEIEAQHQRILEDIAACPPSVIQPLPYTNTSDGGYYFIPRDLFRVKHNPEQTKKSLYEWTEAWQNNRLYPDALNYLQSTPCRVNKFILCVFETLEGEDMAGLPDDIPRKQKEPTPPWEKEGMTYKQYERKYKNKIQEKWRAVPEYYEELELIKEWEQRYRQRINDNKKKAQQFRRLVDNNVSGPIFFNTYSDWRGRILYRQWYNNPQGREESRAMIELYEGKPLSKDGLKWFKIHIVNCFGHDKESVTSKLLWFNNHEEQILACAKDPFDSDNLFWWESCEKPLMFLAACRAYFECRDLKTPCHLFVEQDGSQNGVAHLCVMSKDAELAPKLNINLATEDDKPQDFYTEIAKQTAKLIEETVNNGPPPEIPANAKKAVREQYYKNLYHYQAAAIWKGKVERAIVKRPTMTFSYSSKEDGRTKQIYKSVIELDEDYNGGYLGKNMPIGKFKACSGLSHFVTIALKNKASGPYKLMMWMQKEISDPCSDANLPLKWTSAVGNPITQVKYHKDSKQVVTPWGKYDVIYPSLAFNTNKIHKEKQRNAVPANRTHELDSSHLVLIVNACKKKGKRLITIHDCFSCHPNDVEEIRDIIWDTFKELYSIDRVEDFRKSANEYYQNGLREEDEDNDVMLHRKLMILIGDVIQAYTDYGDLELPDKMPLYFFS